jgi:hypothetical protein
VWPSAAAALFPKQVFGDVVGRPASSHRSWPGRVSCGTPGRRRPGLGLDRRLMINRVGSPVGPGRHTRRKRRCVGSRRGTMRRPGVLGPSSVPAYASRLRWVSLPLSAPRFRRSQRVSQLSVSRTPESVAEHRTFLPACWQPVGCKERVAPPACRRHPSSTRERTADVTSPMSWIPCRRGGLVTRHGWLREFFPGDWEVPTRQNLHGQGGESVPGISSKEK